MTKEEFNEVQEYIYDHFNQFNGYPEEVETNDGTVYLFKDYLKYLEI